MNRKNRILELSFIVLGLILFLIPFLLVPVCQPMADGKFMKCKWMGEAVRGSGLILFFMNMILIFIKNQPVKKGISVGNLGFGLYVILVVSKLIGTCQSTSMACNLYSKPSILLTAGLFILLNLIYIFTDKK